MPQGDNQTAVNNNNNNYYYYYYYYQPEYNYDCTTLSRARCHLVGNILYT